MPAEEYQACGLPRPQRQMVHNIPRFDAVVIPQYLRKKKATIKKPVEYFVSVANASDELDIRVKNNYSFILLFLVI